jgi:hypothetical protein
MTNSTPRPENQGVQDKADKQTVSEAMPETGLTDDERVSREDLSPESGARVKPGPADAERMNKP